MCVSRERLSYDTLKLELGGAVPIDGTLDGRHTRTLLRSLYKAAWREDRDPVAYSLPCSNLQCSLAFRPSHKGVLH